MRLLGLLVVLVSVLVSFAVYAEDFTPPIEQNNVTVLQNANPASCQAAANGEADPAEVVNYSTVGQSGGISSPGIRSCTGCAVDSKANCVCNQCYYYFNE